jgi:hypothetical protein
MALIINSMIGVAAPMSVETLTRDNDIHLDWTLVAIMVLNVDWHWHDLELLLLYLSGAQ